jgi:hypothetical protein
VSFAWTGAVAVPGAIAYSRSAPISRAWRSYRLGRRHPGRGPVQLVGLRQQCPGLREQRRADGGEGDRAAVAVE